MLHKVPMGYEYFGEGLTYRNGKLIQLTYKAYKGFVYDIHDLDRHPTEFSFETTTGEGWGLTYDDSRDELVVTDGSDLLLFWDPETYEEKRRLHITRMNGHAARQINELEYFGTPVPEPSSLAFLGLAITAFGVRRFRKK